MGLWTSLEDVQPKPHHAAVRFYALQISQRTKFDAKYLGLADSFISRGNGSGTCPIWSCATHLLNGKSRSQLPQWMNHRGPGWKETPEKSWNSGESTREQLQAATNLGTTQICCDLHHNSINSYPKSTQKLRHIMQLQRTLTRKIACCYLAGCPIFFGYMWPFLGYRPSILWNVHRKLCRKDHKKQRNTTHFLKLVKLVPCGSEWSANLWHEWRAISCSMGDTLRCTTNWRFPGGTASLPSENCLRYLLFFSKQTWSSCYEYISCNL